MSLYPKEACAYAPARTLFARNSTAGNGASAVLLNAHTLGKINPPSVEFSIVSK